MSKFIRIATWNANGLLQHKSELEVFLREQKIDICLISESHCTKNSFMKIYGFKVYHSYHPSGRARGGAAVIVRDTINHHEETPFTTEFFQAATVKVQCSRYKLVVSAIYSPPRYNIKSEDYVKFLANLGNTFILGGEFNAKHVIWGSRYSSTKGRELLRAGEFLDCSFISSGSPSYWPTDINKYPDVIDFLVTRGISTNYVDVESCIDLSSDHTPVILTLSDRIIYAQPLPSLTNNRTDWEGYRKFLEKNISATGSPRTEDLLEEEVTLFTNLLQRGARENTPPPRKFTKGKTYPVEVRQLIREKRKVRRSWQRTRDPSYKTEFNRLNQKLKRLLANLKNNEIDHYLKNLSAEANTNFSLWKATKRIKNPTLPAPPLRDGHGSWAKNNQEKADLFADHLESVFKPFSNNEANEAPEQTEINGDNAPIEYISFREVKQVIKRLAPKKAPGYDKITAQLLKELPDIGLVKLTQLFNSSLRLKYVPLLWKKAEVITIPKPGKPLEEVTSYRPISLLPIISKVYEKLIAKRLKVIIERRGLLPNHQFGFRDCHSTIDQIHRLVDYIEKALEDKKVCSAVFLDVSQAFDKVWHEGLILKLSKLLPKSFSSLLTSYLQNRFFRIRYYDAYSSYRVIEAGVPQGSILGPILYLLYTSDVPVVPGVKVATFADDTAFLATGADSQTSARKLQYAANTLTSWSKKWRIKLNESKSQHVNFTLRRELRHPIYINGQIIPYSDTAKYLGMTLDVKLHWKEHIRIKSNQLKLTWKKMRWLAGRNSNLSIHNKLMLYKQIIKPIWTYGIQIWGCCSNTNLKSIQTIQNGILREIVNAPWYCRDSDIHRDLHMKTVAEERQLAALQHQKRLQNHVNRLATHLANPEGLFRRLKRIKPCDLVP